MQGEFRVKKGGYSLIELIVAIAIAAIIVTIIGTVMVSSAHGYGSANAESSVQARAQIIMNQIEDLVIDTRGSVRYGYMNDAADTHWLRPEDSDPADPGYGRKLQLEDIYTGVSTNEYCDLEWIKDEGKLMYREKSSFGTESKELLADGVTAFSCDISAVSTNRVLGVDFTIKKGKKQYRATKNISIRNPLTVSASASVSKNEVDIVLTNENITVEPNMKMMLYGARVRVKEGKPSSTKVEYSFEGGSLSTPGGSTIDNKTGILTVAENEKAETIKIYANPVVAPEKKKGPIQLYVRQVKKVSANCVHYAKPGQIVKVKAYIEVVHGCNDTRRDNAKLQEVKFYYRGKEQSSSGDELSFKIPFSAQEGDKYQITVKAVHPFGNKEGNTGLSDGYYRDADHSATVAVEVVEPGSDVTEVLDTKIFRGQETVTLAKDPFNGIPGASEYRFYYREAVEGQQWGFKNGLSSTKPEDMGVNWTLISGNAAGQTSFNVPEVCYSGTGIEEEKTWQFAAVVKMSDSEYRLCGRGEFSLPKFSLHIEDNKTGNYITEGSVKYRLFKLRGDTTLPGKGEDPINIGQVETAFGAISYQGVNHDLSGYGKYFYGDIKVKCDDSKEIENDWLDDPYSQDNNIKFRIKDGKMENTGIKFPAYADGKADGKTVSRNGISDNDVEKRVNKYELKVIQIASEKEGNSYNKTVGPFSEPTIKVETRIGNAVFRVQADDYSLSDPKYEYWPVFIPPPDSADDLMKELSGDVSSSYLPAADTLPVYINTMVPGFTKKNNIYYWNGTKEYSVKSHNVDDKNRYPIQMRIYNGKRYIRVWYPENVKLKSNEAGETGFTADTKYFIGTYRYNKDNELWELVDKDRAEPPYK